MQNPRFTRQIIWVLFTLILSVSPLHAETENALLWQIETPDGGVSYLFGTIHSDDPRVLNLPKPVATAFDSARTLALELDLGKEDSKALGQAMLLPEGRDLLSLVGPDLYAQSVIAMGERGYPEGVVRRMEPWAVFLTLSMPRPESGLYLDYVLYMGAQEQGKKIVGLERMAEQLEIFTTLNRDEQVTLLGDTLRDYKQFPAMFQELIRAYLNRDLAALVSLSEQEMASSDKALEQRFKRVLLEERNHRMAQRLAPLLQKGGVFVAVGAMHLPGEEGLLTLLKKQGLTIKPVY